MKNSSADFYHFSGNRLSALAATLLGLLKILLADRFVLEEMITSSQLDVANVALHAVWMIKSFVVDDTVTNNLLLAYTALFSVRLMTLGAIGIVVFREKFALQPFATVFAPEAFFVKHFAQSSTAIFS